jgi:hypothetical protein
MNNKLTDGNACERYFEKRWSYNRIADRTFLSVTVGDSIKKESSLL